MLNNLLEFIPGTGNNAGNWYFGNFGEACVYALIGFLIVFLGIVLIIFIIWLIGLIMRKTDNLAFLHNWKQKIKGKKIAVRQETISENNDDSDDIPDEVKAAIMAAIMAYYSRQSPKCEFKVKRIKRI